MTGSAHRLFDCHPAGGTFSCPLSPGFYVADIHDRFSLEIKDPGWQEALTHPEDLQDQEPTLLLSRIADPDQRVMVDTGPTGPSYGDTQLLPNVTSIQVTANALATCLCNGEPLNPKTMGVPAKANAGCFPCCAGIA